LSTAAHLVFFYHPDSNRQTHDIRLIVASLFAKIMVLPFFGFRLSQPVTLWLRAALARNILPISVVAIVFLGVAALFYMLAKGPKDAWYLALACGTVALFSFYFARAPAPIQLEPHVSGRYAFVPQVLFAWTLVAIASVGQGHRSHIALVVTVVLCLVSTTAYFDPADLFAHGPRWSGEMATWHVTPGYSPRVWPNGWVLPMPLRPQ
jgi:hypothetical protein